VKWICGVKTVIIRHKDNGDEALRFPSNHVSVELNQQVTFAHPLTFRDPNFEPLSIQADRFKSDMNQNFDTFVGCKSDRVPFPVDLRYLPTAWRQNPMIERVDGQALASHPLSENRIRHFLKWDNRTGQGGIE
jgi:hypothetical protein